MSDMMFCGLVASSVVCVLAAYISFTMTTPMHHVSICNRFGGVFNQTYRPDYMKDLFTT